MFRFHIRPYSFLSLLPFLAMVGIGHSLFAQSYPIPKTVSLRWELAFEPGDLRLHIDQTNGQAYWFFTYKITNFTRRTRVWAPTFVLFTDAGEILESGENVSRRVTNDLLKLMGNQLLENQTQIIGDVLEGKAMAREGLVIWPARNTRVNRMKMFIGGISGETTRIKNPVTGEKHILRKTLVQDYLISGDALPRGHQPIKPVGGSRWILR